MIFIVYNEKGFFNFFLFKDLKKVAFKIIEVMCVNIEILVVGDYDVDGVISFIIMVKFFESLNYKYVCIVIFNCFMDGYGIFKKFLEKYYVFLIIMVDNGINVFEVVWFCKEKNYILIIIDYYCLNNDEVLDVYVVINFK